MRDIFVAFLVFSSLPAILYNPYVGVIVYTWLSVMNPHRLAWGFARTFPFAEIVAVFTIGATLLRNAEKRFPATRETLVLFLFLVWTLVTTTFALNPDEAWLQMAKVVKIQFFVFATMALITTRRKLDLFVWVIVLSIGFYGVKGGLFTILTGGQHRVEGPFKTFISGNNHLGLAMVMTIPLMRYLHKTTEIRWARLGLAGAMFLTAVAILGTHSRGALIGLLAMGFLLFVKGRRGRLLVASLILVLLPLTLQLMPEKWFERMNTLRAYEEDASAMGRINAWKFAFNLAKARPLVGGGFEVFRPRFFSRYAPDPEDVHDAHSIYFEVLGEQGFVGIALFLTLAFFAWRSCSKMAREAERRDGPAWIPELARMMQVSLFGYGVAGAFVGLAYFDLYYNLIAIVVAAKLLANEEQLAVHEPEYEPVLRVPATATR